MLKLKTGHVLSAAVALGALASHADAAIVITEFSRGGAAGEFVEITNTGTTQINLTGWSFNDASSSPPGFFSIGSLGTLNAGESAIISELDAATFRTNWNLSAAVKVVGGNNQNLGNGDSMNIYDASSALIDSIAYPGGQTVVDGETWATTPSFYHLNSFANWSKSASGDAFGSFQSTAGYYGSPGVAPVPLPAAGFLLLSGLGLLGPLARRKRS